MSPPAYIKVSNVGGGAAPGDVESMRKDLDKILGRDEHGTAQVRMILIQKENFCWTILNSASFC